MALPSLQVPWIVVVDFIAKPRRGNCGAGAATPRRVRSVREVNDNTVFTLKPGSRLEIVPPYDGEMGFFSLLWSPGLSKPIGVNKYDFVLV